MSREIDAKLIEKAAEGDPVAFGEIYFLLRNPIYGFVYRMLNETGAAEDITQEVFIFFIEHPKKYEPLRGSLHSFLCGVARNRIMHHLRKSGNRPEINRDETEDYREPKDEIGGDPLGNLLNQELAEKVEESIGKLPPLQREVVILREIEELSYEEIAGITQTELGTVKVRLHRARRALAERLSPYLMKKKEKCYEMR